MHYPPSAVSELSNIRCEADFVPCRPGKNSLDFHLVADMAFRAHHDPDAEYVILSNDTGYDSAIEYIRDLGYSARRMGFGSGEAEPADADSAHPNARYYKAVAERWPRLKPNHVKALADILLESEKISPVRGGRKSFVHTKLMQACGNDTKAASTYYHSLKDLIKA